jgi:anti-anti-sigma regulatory factor
MKIFEFDNSNEVGILTLIGELTRDVRTVLSEAFTVSLDSSRHLLVNLERVTSIDDACLEVFDAARERAVGQQKRIAFYGLQSEE